MKMKTIKRKTTKKNRRTNINTKTAVPKNIKTNMNKETNGNTTPKTRKREKPPQRNPREKKGRTHLGIKRGMPKKLP